MPAVLLESLIRRGGIRCGRSSAEYRGVRMVRVYLNISRKAGQERRKTLVPYPSKSYSGSSRGERGLEAWTLSTYKMH